jgi:hypothetical protein
MGSIRLALACKLDRVKIPPGGIDAICPMGTFWVPQPAPDGDGYCASLRAGDPRVLIERPNRVRSARSDSANAEDVLPAAVAALDEGIRRYNRGDYSGAAAAFSDTVQSDPEHPWPWWLLTRAHLAVGECSHARRALVRHLDAIRRNHPATRLEDEPMATALAAKDYLLQYCDFMRKRRQP